MINSTQFIPQLGEINIPRPADAGGECLSYDRCMVNVFLADSQPEERTALHLLVSDLRMKVVGEAEDWPATLALAPATHFDLLLVDWNLLPAEPTTALTGLRSACAGSITVVLLSHMDPRQQAANSVGADVFISKGETPERVAERLKGVAIAIRRDQSFINSINRIEKGKEWSKMDIKIPQALVKDHQEIQAEMEKAVKEGGLIGSAATKLMAAMKPHTEHEEKFALPPLGLLSKLIAGKLEDEMDIAAVMADDLKVEMPHMLNEHKMINSALDELETAITQENKPAYLEFVQRMKLHLQEEEEVYYPAALLVGMFLKVKLASLVQFRNP